MLLASLRSLLILALLAGPIARPALAAETPAGDQAGSQMESPAPATDDQDEAPDDQKPANPAAQGIPGLPSGGLPGMSGIGDQSAVPQLLKVALALKGGGKDLSADDLRALKAELDKMRNSPDAASLNSFGPLVDQLDARLDELIQAKAHPEKADDGPGLPED